MQLTNICKTLVASLAFTALSIGCSSADYQFKSSASSSAQGEAVLNSFEADKVVLYPAMVHAKVVNDLKVKSIVIAIPKIIDADPAMDLFIQEGFARQLRVLGYYVVPVVISNALFKANGINFGEDFDSVSVDLIRKVLGVDAVFYPVIKKAVFDSGVLVGNSMAFDIESKLVGAGNIEMVNARNSFTLQLSKAVDTRNTFTIAVGVISNLFKAVVANSSDKRLVATVVYNKEVVNKGFALPLNAIYALQKGPYKNKNGVGCLIGTPLEIADDGTINSYQYNYAPMLSYNGSVCNYSVSLYSPNSEINIGDPKYWGLVNFPDEVIKQSEKELQAILRKSKGEK